MNGASSHHYLAPPHFATAASASGCGNTHYDHTWAVARTVRICPRALERLAVRVFNMIDAPPGAFPCTSVGGHGVTEERNRNQGYHHEKTI
ncbi:hypothetical protein PCANC_28544, partial [Puccinia coronata f. sp. avenae]